MDNNAHFFESIIEKAEDYFETKFQLIRLKTVDKSSDVVSSVIAGLAVALILIISTLLLSVGLALWIGKLTGESYYGFFIVAGVYLIAALIVNVVKKTLIKKRIANSFIDKVLN